MGFWRGLGALLFSLAGACKGHVQADARVAAPADTDDRKWEIAEPAASSPSAASAPSAPTVSPPRSPSSAPSGPAQSEPIFIGVTHDLSFAPGAPRTPVCRCLAVTYGSPDDPRFAWASPPPKIGGGLMAIAIAADGVPCDAPGYDPRRASIAGVERQGDDVVITLEQIPEGHPIMHGAFLAPPGPNGALLVHALRAAPYGLPLDGSQGPCRVAMN